MEQPIRPHLAITDKGKGYLIELVALKELTPRQEVEKTILIELRDAHKLGNIPDMFGAEARAKDLFGLSDREAEVWVKQILEKFGRRGVVIEKGVMPPIKHNGIKTNADAEIRELKTLYITAEAQNAMLNLIKKAEGKKIEYGLELVLEDGKIYPGEWKRGAREKVFASLRFPGSIGWFHTHPSHPYSLLTGYQIMGWVLPQPAPPKLSDIDILHILVNPLRRIIGVGVPAYSERLVQFATLRKEVSIADRTRFLKIMPVVITLNVPVEGIEHYYNLYNFDLGDKSVPIEVYL